MVRSAGSFQSKLFVLILIKEKAFLTFTTLTACPCTVFVLNTYQSAIVIMYIMNVHCKQIKVVYAIYTIAYIKRICCYYYFESNQ